MKKKASSKSINAAAEMRPEYEFSYGVRGKHYEALQQGYVIRTTSTDGTVTEKVVEPVAAVTLAPDVREYFTTSEQVNHALRTLISIVPQKRKSRKAQTVRQTREKDRSRARAKKSG